MNAHGARRDISNEAAARTAPRWAVPTWVMDVHEPSPEELLATITALRDEVVRLKDEIRRLRRDHHEVPPHYQ